MTVEQTQVFLIIGRSETEVCTRQICFVSGTWHCASCVVSTLSLKNCHPFYFWNNSVKNKVISIHRLLRKLDTSWRYLAFLFLCTFVPGSENPQRELSLPWNIRSRGAKSLRTFIPWNFRTPGTFAPQERMFQEVSLHGTFAALELSLHKQLSCPLTFAPVEISLHT